MKPNLIVILGPTAVGKTGIGVKLASCFNGEIISADSRQVYRGMDLGTGKDLNEYLIGQTLIPHHLIDVVNPNEEFNLFEFSKLFIHNFKDIQLRKKLPFLVGGTGLYLEAVIKKYNLSEISPNEKPSRFESLSDEELKKKLISLKPDLHNTTDLIDRARLQKAILVQEANLTSASLNWPEINYFVIGVTADRNTIKDRITARLKKRLEEGMIEEVEALLKNGVSHERLLLFGLEYKFIAMYLSGELTYNDMFQKLNSSIHKFAKRQMTWFRKMERSGITINWIENAEEAKFLVEKKIGPIND